MMSISYIDGMVVIQKNDLSYYLQDEAHPLVNPSQSKKKKGLSLIYVPNGPPATVLTPQPAINKSDGAMNEIMKYTPFKINLNG